MQYCFAPYPQAIAQMSEWAHKVSQLDERECAIALHKLDFGRTVTIRRV